MTKEDEMVGWHHQLNGHELEQAPGIGDGQGSLVCCGPWDFRVRCNLVTENKATHESLSINNLVIRRDIEVL